MSNTFYGFPSLLSRIIKTRLLADLYVDIYVNKIFKEIYVHLFAE